MFIKQLARMWILLDETGIENQISMDIAFQYDQYVLKKQVLALTGILAYL